MATRQPGSRLSLLFEVFAASRAVGELLDRALADCPLTPAEYAIYSVLFDEGPQSPSELARRTGVPPTSMSHVVRAMRERGHAERAPDPADGRSYRIVLTRAGLAAHLATSVAFAAAERTFADALASDAGAARATLRAIGRAASDAAARLAREATDATA